MKTFWEGKVLEEWLDYNGHMNDAAYAVVFSKTVGYIMNEIGLDQTGRNEHQYTIFTLESHIKYVAETLLDNPIYASAIILDQDHKRLHLWLELAEYDGKTLAYNEQMIMGIDMSTRRSAPFPGTVQQRIYQLPQIERSHWPKQAHTLIGIRRN